MKNPTAAVCVLHMELYCPEWEGAIFVWLSWMGNPLCPTWRSVEGPFLPFPITYTELFQFGKVNEDGLSVSCPN